MMRPGFLLIIALLAVFLALPGFAPVYYMQFATKALLMGVFALSLNLVVGFGGLVSMCHAAFFGLAGYFLAFTTGDSAGASIWTSLPLTLLVVALAAAVIGVLALRTRGIYFIMTTLAFGEMFFYLFHDTKIAGGSDGKYIYFEPEIVVAGHRLIDLSSKVAFYYVALGLLVATLLFLRAIIRAPFGHALMAARDNERRALSIGLPVFRVRLTAFVLSAMIAGVAGYLSAAQFGFVAPQLLGWHQSATVLVMVVLGGMNGLFGPVIGAFALMGLEEVLKSLFEHWKLIKGIIIIALVFLLPGGLQQLASLVRRHEAGEDTHG